MKASLRILIADDNDEIRGILRAILKGQEAMKVVAEARTGHEAVALARAHKPDVVLMDVEMPRLDGFQALQRILQDRAETKVIMVTRVISRVAVNRAQRLGAKGYVAKRDLHADLVAAIQAITEGGAYFSKPLGGGTPRTCSSGAGTAKDIRATGGKGDDEVQSHNLKGRPNACVGRERPIHNPIRVFLVDDEDMVRTVVAQTLHNDSRFHFVGGGHEEGIVVKAIANEQPDIVLLDIFLGKQPRGGWRILERIRQVCPDAGIIIFTRFTGRADVSEAWRHGAAGYMNKDKWEKEGIHGILAVHAGEGWFSSREGRSRMGAGRTERLKPREREVFYRYVRDLSPQVIAEEMSIGVDTVHVHMSNIRQKIGHQDGWKGISREAQKDPDLLCELTNDERLVFDLYVQGTTARQEIATNIGRSEAEEVENLMRNIRRKLNCHPDGWKGIAREEGDID